MSVPCVSACSPWTTSDDVLACCIDADTDVVETAIAVATDLLFELSGRKFPGSCRDKVRPCAQVSRTVSFPGELGLLDGFSFGGSCACNRDTLCGCNHLSAVVLGAYPITQIVEVKVDGLVVPADEYQVQDWKWLVRLPNADGFNEGWPCCQRLDRPDTATETFSVDFVYGTPPPPAGVQAARDLACQFIRACASSGDGDPNCVLSPRVTQVVRQGITLVMNDPSSLIQNRLTGVPSVDLFLKAYNPLGHPGPAHIVSPDIGPTVRRIT